MNIITLPITALKPYKNNPKKHPPRQIEQLMRSIELTKGLTQPIVIDSNNVIVCGHGRYMAAQKLGYTEIPCVLVDNLTEDEIKAYRLIDNRIASGEYDIQTEIAELQDIEFDMSDFGFDVPALEIELEDKEIRHEENKQTAVDRFTNILNQNKAEYEGVGEYGIPSLTPVYETPEVEKWIDFDYVLREKEPENKGVHFFIHDYKFERIWVQPEQYIDKLKRFAVVATPDFTPFTEFPQAMQIWQYYRKMWVGKFLQENGVTVIPTVRDIWDMHGNPRSWWLDGTPTGGIIMVSDMWSYIPKAQKECEYTMQTIKERIQPSKVYVYNRHKGSDFSKWFDNVEYVSAWSQEKWNG